MMKHCVFTSALLASTLSSSDIGHYEERAVHAGSGCAGSLKEEGIC